MSGGGYITVNQDDTIIGKRLPTSQSLPGFAWGKLYKSSIFKNIHFPERYYYEDTVNFLVLYDKAKKIGYTEDIVYEYLSNQKGICATTSASPKILDTLYVTLQLLKDRQELRLLPSQDFYDRLLQQISINQKRIASLNDMQINLHVFNISKNILQNFNGFTTSQPKLKLIEKSLRNDNYNAFIFACS